MVRSLRPFLLTALSAALFLWAGIVTVGLPVADPPPPPVEPTAADQLVISGDLRRPGGRLLPATLERVRWDDPAARVTVRRDELLAYLADPDRMASDVRPYLRRANPGEVEGYRLLRVGDGSFAHRLGFRAGDIVSSFDEIALTSSASVVRAYDVVRARDAFCVGGSRGNEPYERCYEVVP